MGTSMRPTYYPGGTDGDEPAVPGTCHSSGTHGRLVGGFCLGPTATVDPADPGNSVGIRSFVPSLSSSSSFLFCFDGTNLEHMCEIYFHT